MAFDLSDYVDVAARIQEWYRRFPDGRICTTLVEFTEARVVVVAEVYRDGTDEPAGTGHSSMAIPGTTPYTKGSELENAETSAVGRAIVMAGIPAKSVASEDEVKSKTSGRSTAKGRGQASRDALPDPSPASGTPAGAAGGEPEGNGEGPDGSPPDIAELLQQAVTRYGSLPNVLRKVRGVDDTVRSSADFTVGHLLVLLEEAP